MNKLAVFAVFWLVGLVYYFVTAPAGMTPFPVWFSLTVIGTTIGSLIILGLRFPLFGFFMACLITSLMTGGRVWGAPYYFGRRRRW